MRQKTNHPKNKRFLATLTAIITVAGLLPSTFMAVQAADFTGQQIISSSVLTFQTIPESFHFGSVTSGPSQDLFNNDNTGSAPTETSPGADLLKVYDDRESGGFTVTVDAAGTFTDGVHTIPLNSLYAVTSLDEADAENGDPANNMDFTVSTQDGTAQGAFFKPDGTKMYVTGLDGTDINEYNLASAWNITTATFVQAFGVGSQDTSPQGTFFKSDGTKMYVVGYTDKEVNEYTLSSPWDVSSASFVQAKSVNSEETEPKALFFKSDGTKMYITGSADDEVNEYTLSPAWDVSTASFVQAKSIASEESNAQGLFIRADGLKMYIIGTAGVEVNEYTLASAWDVSTASYVQNKSISAQDITPTDLFFKADGTKMYMIGSNNDKVYQYLLSTPWNISTAVAQTEKAGVTYENTISSGERSVEAPVYVDVDSLNLDTAATFTSLAPDSQFGSGPMVLMDGTLPLDEGRNGTFAQFVSFYLKIPALQADGKYDLILTYTINDSTL